MRARAQLTVCQYQVASTCIASALTVKGDLDLTVWAVSIADLSIKACMASFTIPLRLTRESSSLQLRLSMPTVNVSCAAGIVHHMIPFSMCSSDF